MLKAKTAAKQKIRKKINGQRDDSILNKVHQDVSAIRTEIMAAEKEGFVRRGNNGRNSEKETMNLNKREMENKFAREKAARDILAEKVCSLFFGTVTNQRKGGRHSGYSSNLSLKCALRGSGPESVTSRQK